MAEREGAVEQAAKNTEEHARESAALREELDALRAQAKVASSSETGLSNEVAQLRATERDTMGALDEARRELESLRSALAKSESAANKATEGRAEREAEITKLRTDLDSLRARQAQAVSSEGELSNELDQLRDRKPTRRPRSNRRAASWMR